MLNDNNMEEKSSNVFHNSLFISFLLMIFMILVIIMIIVLASSKFSKFSSDKQLSQISLLLNEEEDSLSKLALEYGWWNEAIEYVFYDKNLDWIDKNLGTYLIDTYALSWVLAFDLNGNLQYGKHKDEIIESSPIAIFDKSINQLIDDTMKSSVLDPATSSGILTINGELHIASAIIFAAYEPTDLDMENPHGYLILTKKITDELLASFSSKTGVSNIFLDEGDDFGNQFHMENKEHLLFQNPLGNTNGVLYWTKDSAVRDFINSFLFLAVFLIFCILLLSLFFYRNLYKYHNLTRRIISNEKDNSQKLSYKANYDDLTGLSNRHLFIDRLGHGIKRCLRNKQTSAMLFIDLDGFKNINDTLGHEKGDELLVQVSKKFQGLVRNEDTISRFGGDEFCILLEDVGTAGNVDRVLSKIQDMFELPFFLSEEKQYINASIGVVLIPDDGNDTVSLLRFADIAMYQAKSKGNMHYQYFSPELDKKAHSRAIIRNGLRNAIGNRELSLHYQPIYNLNDKSLKYVEALLRWNRPGSGFISPEEFIPIAEESGIIQELGYWIIEQSIKDILEINATTDSDIHLSINISVNQLRDPNFLDKFLKLIDSSTVDRSIIQLEITENILIDDSIYNNEVLLRLSESGFKLVMDDFGTGYSSLSYIQNIPLHTIKIDKSFVSMLNQDYNNGALIKTIVFMADSFGLNTVAEGIETIEQENYLLSIGCKFGQGYLYCKPVSKDEIINKIANESITVLKE